ncbi:VWA domain-containing protein [Polynucleobacter paneuropaeus]|nr:VWA domain-containing protein [Polynucleobacter paneuropaeus]MBT8531263.1 VWA domain-containing protein [Polynucleobacter paneuropaeus]MBT8602180.1 VWA domain-containing protein [Polynucleobacter paneuropaeus]MBT8624132.1 VWA domain-containing protein [Polynucleobacter paneuropaeus]MBT8628983.1 VWA domain-containing protein [Polynucleobacter paneuropaeus]
MINGKQLEVVLDTRKAVMASNSGESLDVLLRLRAPTQEIVVGTRAPLAVSLVIDRSGSMGDGRLTEAKRCALDLLSRLQDDDWVSVVIYDDQIEVLLETMSVRIAKTLLPIRLEEIQPRNMTNLHGGWLKGAETLAPRAGRGIVSRVILLSDGQANHGLVSVEDICAQVRELANAGVTTSTVGIGFDFNEELMTAIATAGQGNSWYGQRAEDLAESFDAELGFLNNLVWQDVRIHLETPMLSHMGQIKVRNDYVQNAGRQYCLPAIAQGSEVWMAISLSMSEVIHLQDNRSVLRCTILAKDKEGIQHEFTVSLPQMPVVSLAEYQLAPENELVARRFNEVEAADIQREARLFVRDRNWSAVERLMIKLEDRSRENPWLAETVSYLRTLLERRDHEAMEKELMYSSDKLKNRVADLNDTIMFCMSEEAVKPAFMRRKVNQGRNTESQNKE